jgi:hypothetical protein
MDFAPIIWLGLVFISGSKMFFDQYRLLKLYRHEINPPYPIAYGERMNLAEDPFGIKTSMRATRVVFSKYPKNPNLEKAAIRVKIDMLVTITIGIVGFILIALIFVQ